MNSKYEIMKQDHFRSLVLGNILGMKYFTGIINNLILSLLDK